MQNENTKEERAKKTPVWKRLFFSPALEGKNKSHIIAYIAVMTALCVASNLFEFKLADTQFSLTLCVSMLAGIVLGSACGFVACFLGDLVGFFVNSSGFAYMPWIGISMGLAAFLAGLLVNGVDLPFKGALYVKLSLVCAATFAICTVGINTTAFWLIYSKVSYGTYLFTRLFVLGQIWNSLANYALLFVFVPVLANVKPLRLKIR